MQHICVNISIYKSRNTGCWKRRKKMAFSYKPLWKLLIDNDLSKKELMKKTEISKSTMDKMYRGEFVSMEIIDRLCNYFECNVEDVIVHISNKEVED